MREFLRCFFLTPYVMKNFFCMIFCSRIFACKKISLKSIQLTWLMNLFFVIKTVHHTFVSTFFECEMSILYKEYISELKIVEAK